MVIMDFLEFILLVLVKGLDIIKDNQIKWEMVLNFFLKLHQFHGKNYEEDI